jgi:hypothetical protein
MGMEQLLGASGQLAPASEGSGLADALEQPAATTRRARTSKRSLG